MSPYTEEQLRNARELAGMFKSGALSDQPRQHRRHDSSGGAGPAMQRKQAFAPPQHRAPRVEAPRAAYNPCETRHLLTRKCSELG